jgi:hypothetical protein
MTSPDEERMAEDIERFYGGRPAPLPTGVVPVEETLVPLSELSAALDEVFRLRRALAYEAGVLAAHLEMKSFPRSRRAMAEDSVRRMRAAARGGARPAYGDVASWAFNSAMRDAGAPETLTRSALAAERNPG